MKAIKIYEQLDNKTFGIFTDGKIFLAMTFTKSKEFKTLKGAEKWINQFI